MTQTAERSWTASAACASIAPDSLFVVGAAQRQARQVCFSCAVRSQCLADALESGADFGVWGGLTERERRLLLRRFPDVTNWLDVLLTDEREIFAELRSSQAPRLLTARTPRADGAPLS